MTTQSRTLFSIHNNNNFFTDGLLDKSKTLAVFEKFLTDNEEKINSLEIQKESVVAKFSNPGFYLIETYGTEIAQSISTKLNALMTDSKACCADDVYDAVYQIVGGIKQSKILFERLKEGFYSDGTAWVVTERGRGKNSRLSREIEIGEQVND
jgi:hypothetical protein